MKILCAGLREIRSGKTTLAIALLRYFKNKGIKCCPFKPRAGTNLWDHWMIVMESLEKGTFYGFDAKKLYMEVDGIVPITIINPVSRLWHQNLGKNIWGELPDFIFDRVTTNGSDNFIFNENVDRSIILENVNQIFVKNANDCKYFHIKTFNDFEKVEPLYEQAINETEKYLANNNQVFIYESYADVGMPMNDIPNLDYVFVIEPLNIQIYEGKLYLNSFKIQSTFRFEEKTKDIISTLNPIQSIKFPLFEKDFSTNFLKILEPILDDLF